MATDDTALKGPSQAPDKDPAQFEQYCRKIAARWAKGALNPPYRIEYRTHEPIDILIEESGVPDMPGFPNARQIAGKTVAPRHFIECKLYGRELGLNAVGAPYLYAFRERPSSLVIATNQELTGGAREFASWLFNTHMGKTTTLYTWNPFEDEATDRAPKDDTPTETTWSVHREAVTIDRWSLRERMPFQDIPVASSDSESRKEYSLRLDAILVFRAFLRNPIRGRRIGNVTLRFGTSEQDVVNVLLDQVGRVAGGLEIQGIIRASDLCPGVSYPPPDMDVTMSGGKDRLCGIPGFPSLRVESKVIVLPDLRSDETDCLYDKWMRTNDVPILLIQGEGGVGKTYFCEQIAERAVRVGFRAAHTPLEVRTELAFVAEIVWLLLSPDLRTLLNETEQTLTANLLVELGVAYGTSLTEDDATALATLLLEGRWEGSSPDVLLQAIAHLIVNSHRPLLFIVSNAHRLSDGVGYGIRTLLGSIEAAGWGQVRLIVEARDTPEDMGDNWLNLKAWMANALGHRITEYTVRPLDETKIRGSLSAAIASADDCLMASIITGKSGGNPLFLRHLLQSLLEQDVIETLPSMLSKEGGPTYTLPSISRLRTAVGQMGINVEDLLIRRIHFWDSRLRSASEGWAGFVLGLMSILETEVSVTLLAALAARPTEAVETTLMTFGMAGLVSRRPNESFCFSHEFAASAARTWLQAQSDVHARIATVADYPISVADTHAFGLALSKGRLHAFLRRHARALESFNAALQLAGTNFDSIFRCRRDMHNVLAADPTGGTAHNFHANLEEYLNTGNYILPCEKNIEINKQALAIIQAGPSTSLSRSERKFYARRYHHNLSSLALRSLDTRMFFEHCRAVLDGSSSLLEMARLLNRAIKICATTGAVSVGRQFGEIASLLQAAIGPNEDLDLESVLLGEMSFLYAGVLPRVACDLAEEAFRKGKSERQRAHNLFARACARLRIGEIEGGTEDFKSYEDLVASIALRTMSPGVDMLNGILALFRSDWREAASSFRMGMADTAWLGFRREELRIGTNLVVARAFAGDLDAASRLNDALLTLATRIYHESPEQHLDEMLRQVRSRANAELGLIVGQPAVATFPDIQAVGPHIVAPLIINAAALNRLFPEAFSPLSRFGITGLDIELRPPTEQGQLSFRSDISDLTLHVAC